MNRSVAALTFLLFCLMFGLSYNHQAGAAGVVQAGQGAPAPDIRYLLDGRGLAAYTALPVYSLDYVRPLFSSVAITGSNYLAGIYTLSGRTDQTLLAMGLGWAVALYSRSTGVYAMFDCPTFSRDNPTVQTSLPEIAIREIASALHVTPTIGYYDFRNPAATGLALHWLHLRTSGQAYGALTLPLENTYLDRGYVLCSNLNSSRLYLNGAEITYIQWPPGTRLGALAPDQLRAGQANNWQAGSTAGWYDSSSTSIVGAVLTVYSGTVPLPASGGYTRTLALSWPDVLGPPLTFSYMWLPAVRR